MDKCRVCGRKGEGSFFWTEYKDDVAVSKICNTCKNLESLNRYRKTGTIETDLLVQAGVSRVHLEWYDRDPEDCRNRLRKEVLEYDLQNRPTLLELSTVIDGLSELVTEFEKKHWNPYLKAYWNKAEERGHATECDGIDVLMWGSAGRVLITLRNDVSDFTMIFSDYVATEEDEDKWYIKECSGGIQGINATTAEATQMIKSVIAAEKLEFKPKKEVTLAGL